MTSSRFTRAGLLVETQLQNDTGNYRSIFTYGVSLDTTIEFDWSDSIQAALDDPDTKIIYFPPGDYKVTRCLFSTQPGKKLIGASGDLGVSRIHFYLADATIPAGLPGPTGIWFKNKGDVSSLRFIGEDFTREMKATILRFQRTIFTDPPDDVLPTGPGLSDEADMDSSVENCSFAGLKKFSSTEDPGGEGGAAIIYWGRNMICKGNFFNGKGDALQWGFPNNLSDPFSYQNPSQGTYYGFRRNQFTDNTYHSSDGRMIKLIGNVAIRNAIIANNLMDIGGQLLYCGAPGGMIGGLIDGNNFFQDFNNGLRNSFIRFDQGLVYDVNITSNVFSGGDDVDADRGYDYLFNNNPTTTQPSKGFVTANTSNLRNTTTFYVNNVDEDGQDITVCLQNVLNTTADFVNLVVQERDLPSETQIIYRVEGITYGSKVSAVQVSYLRDDGLTTFPQGTPIFFNFNPHWPIKDGDEDDNIFGTKQPEYVMQFGAACRISGLNITGNSLRCAERALISFRAVDATGIVINGNILRDPGGLEPRGAISFTAPANQVIISNNYYGQIAAKTTADYPLVDFNGEACRNVKVINNISDLSQRDVPFCKGAQNVIGNSIIENN